MSNPDPIPVPTPPRMPSITDPLPEGEVIATLDEDRRPTYTECYMMINEAGGIAVKLNGEVQWIPK